VVVLAAGGFGLLACSSVEFPEGTGGTAGAISGSGGGRSGAGGSVSGGTGGGPIIEPNDQGSCITGHTNPDSAPGGACASDCQSVSCGRLCTEDCCVTCGIDQAGSKICVCPTPGSPYANCSCVPPTFIPAGLQGGPCSPQGYSTATVPATAPEGSISLRGMPCRQMNLVCFTIDSTATAERGCICESDSLMHCGSVNHWFTNNGVPTEWMPQAQPF
jgi:hypothetical protein